MNYILLYVTEDGKHMNILLYNSVAGKIHELYTSFMLLKMENYMNYILPLCY